MTDKLKELKKLAAYEAVKSIRSGMIIGLGSGSTAYFALEGIAELIKTEKLENIMGIPTSLTTEKNAREFGIPLTGLDNIEQIDITIDGADEVDSDLNLIKGGGGALLREKIIAQLTKYEIIIVDESKVSKNLGQNFPVPVEIVPFACESEKRFLRSIGGNPVLRLDENGEAFVTDEGNYILDFFTKPLINPEEFSHILNSRAAIVEHGLFIGLTHEVIIAGKSGIQSLKK